MMRPKPRSRMPSITGRVMLKSEVEIGADDGGPLVLGHLVEEAVAGDAGIVDQDVDRPVLGLDLGDAGGAGVVIADVPFVDRDAGLRLELGGRLVIAGIVGRDL